MSNNDKAIIAAVKDDPMVIQAMNNLNEVKAIQQTVFQKGVHYGAPYKGSKNDTLLKPGATFLQQKFQLHEQHERLETTIHVNVDDLSKSYIIIQNRCRILNNDGLEVAQADAACTTFEDKYVYRGGGDRTCPSCGNANIMRSAYPPKSNPTAEKGWYCNPKKGGCGASFDYNTPAITDQEVAKTRNENPLNLLDTIVAMAQKRASVRATIKATGVDALFSPGDGVTVDYYDDMDQSSDELITVVDKHSEKSASDQLRGNGPTERTIAGKPQNGVKNTPTATTLAQSEGQNATDDLVGANKGIWDYDRVKLLMEVGKVCPTVHYQERSNTVQAMERENVFANISRLEGAVTLVKQRLETHKIAKNA